MFVPTLSVAKRLSVSSGALAGFCLLYREALDQRRLLAAAKVLGSFLILSS